MVKFIVAGSKRDDLMTGSKQLATGLRGLGNDDDLRWDDGNFRWGDADHRWDFGGHGDHCAVHKDLVLSVAPTATSGDFTCMRYWIHPGRPRDGRC